ncbi:hypothetical protein M3Y96_01187500 [Aphelenchoides besseyi]|nr:hypothetical protein M3Y96_01187500 [Aphelenchoides besseyi]
MFDFMFFATLQFTGYNLLVVFMLCYSLLMGCAKKKNNAEGKPVPHGGPKASELKPQVIPKNEKEEMIARGQIKPKGKHDYPTMDDVVSDWETEEEGPDGEKKKGKKKKVKGKSKMAEVPVPKSKATEVKTDAGQTPETNLDTGATAPK